ncbi:hypothetical protein DUNSADRAFT_1881 [Dunaliella salina]|uniref:Uncharacterized protein n=1 Tax=Dunaliella salina TaxID=3046 RepID=A0ABQ7FWW5_DUNSA|nr:hypothetical protein DUNSADRAFT_1881 [Dunaliella salina]|eukprot:KAF5826852.1 hypothetical protein DUNSADRAFT_1881 [Dunaliella salina]
MLYLPKMSMLLSPACALFGRIPGQDRKSIESISSLGWRCCKLIQLDLHLASLAFNFGLIVLDIFYLSPIEACIHHSDMSCHPCAFFGAPAPFHARPQQLRLLL